MSHRRKETLFWIIGIDKIHRAFVNLPISTRPVLAVSVHSLGHSYTAFDETFAVPLLAKQKDEQPECHRLRQIEFAKTQAIKRVNEFVSAWIEIQLEFLP